MTTYPKVIKAEMLTNNMLALSFDNDEKRYLKSHYLEDYVNAYSFKKVKEKTRRLLLVRPTITAYGSNFEIKDDGTLILNEKDVYTPEELWENSKTYI